MDYQGTNLVPSSQPETCNMHGLAAAELGPGGMCLFQGCGAEFQEVEALELHMRTHDFGAIVDSGLVSANVFAADNLTGYAGHPGPVDGTPIGNVVANEPTAPPGPPPPSTAASGPHIAASVPVELAPGRHTCTHPICGRTFKRVSDLHRHAKAHQPGARKYECFVPGCPYRGAKGFLRRDKLLSHQRNAHGLRY